MIDIKTKPSMEAIRELFPALHQVLESQCSPIYLDGAGGSQMPQSVIDAMADAMQQGLSNLGGHFHASSTIDLLVNDARQHAADLLNAPNKDSIVFGANMTTLTQYMSWMIAADWRAGDEIVLSELDHGANRSFWEIQASLKGAVVRYIPVISETCQLDMQAFTDMISEKTKFIAVTAASNLTGSIVDLASIVAGAKSVGAVTYVDAVHLAPHKKIDVTALEADYVVCSAYKFFGPHVGILYGREEMLAQLVPNKVKPAPNKPPRCFETGTPNIPCLAGVIACIRYIGSLGEGQANMAEQLEAGYKTIESVEATLLQHARRNIQSVKGVTLLGHSTPDSDLYTLTFALTFDNCHSSDMAKYLGTHGVYSWNGHLYADRLTNALGIDHQGGALRLSLMHYNTLEEIDKVCCLIESKVASN